MSDYIDMMEYFSNMEIELTKQFKDLLKKQILKKEELLNYAARVSAQRHIANFYIEHLTAENKAIKLSSACTPEQVDKALISIQTALKIGKQDTIDIAAGENMRKRHALLKNLERAAEETIQYTEVDKAEWRKLARDHNPDGKKSKRNIAKEIAKSHPRYIDAFETIRKNI